MKHYLTAKTGEKIIVEEDGWENGKVYLSIYCGNKYGMYFWRNATLKMYYRHERTWDDHMGNTPCGYYAIVPILKVNGHTERRRVYLRLAM